MTEKIHKGKLRTLDDIQRDREAQEREDMKDRISTDIKDVMNRVTGKDVKPRKKGIIKRILKWSLIALFALGLLVLVVNFVLLNIWALKFFIKELFLG